jgi:hypothetical protein
MTGLGRPPINLVNDILGVELVHFLTQVIGPMEGMKKITSN